MGAVHGCAWRWCRCVLGRNQSGVVAVLDGYRKRIPALPWACERSSGEVGVGAVYRSRSGCQMRALATGSAKCRRHSTLRSVP